MLNVCRIIVQCLPPLAPISAITRCSISYVSSEGFPSPVAVSVIGVQEILQRPMASILYTPQLVLQLLIVIISIAPKMIFIYYVRKNGPPVVEQSSSRSRRPVLPQQVKWGLLVTYYRFTSRITTANKKNSIICEFLKHFLSLLPKSILV